MQFTKTLGLLATFGALASALPTNFQRRDGGNSTASATGDNNSNNNNNNTTTTTTTTTNGVNSSNGSSGSVNIQNNMGSTMYLWSVSENADPMITVQPGGSYSESWRTNPDGGGISIKMAMKPEQVDVLQYEYTLQGDTIFWDLSCIDMGTSSQFTTAGFAVTSSDSTCPSATCQPGDSACADAYLVPDDNQATHGCPAGTQMNLNIGSSA
ncbi:hypothetical protein UA08_01631 [Talaromyces atroroseus]|uniref:Extracellular thaumatin domain protein n=1 Tax=Talaromyces atroroseus TaxID=1441469 RepID=A0A1Q5Q9Q9_TALAT|nr:hypothetical protein UA08_01631 [Talaromyces atroroseus]OKL62660.1 hypothetical protein UA08_01631 [Talaromyces atroroseus]